MLLTHDLHSIGHAAGKKPRVEERDDPPARICQPRRFQGERGAQAQQTAYGKLDAAHSYPVRLEHEVIHQQDMYRIAQGAEEYKQISPLKPKAPGRHAEEIESRKCQDDRQPGDPGASFTQEQARHRHHHDIEGRDKSGFPRVRIHKAKLLQIGGEEKAQATA